MRSKVADILYKMFARIGMDCPSNFDDIVDFVVDDVRECADSRYWGEGDVAIAFRRWIESR